MTDTPVVIDAGHVARDGETVSLGTYACPCGCGWVVELIQTRRDQLGLSAVLETTIKWVRREP